MKMIQLIPLRVGQEVAFANDSRVCKVAKRLGPNRYAVTRDELTVLWVKRESLGVKVMNCGFATFRHGAVNSNES
jgi:hypothetical protein